MVPVICGMLRIGDLGVSGLLLYSLEMTEVLLLSFLKGMKKQLNVVVRNHSGLEGTSTKVNQHISYIY